MKEWEKKLTERKAAGIPKPEPKRMGFWKLDSWDSEDAEDARDAEVREKCGIMTDRETVACLAYMEAASTTASYMGWATCRVKDCGTQLGTSDMLTPDGRWVFPERWDHYILAHGVRPDEAFIQDALVWKQDRRNR
jgi:hypothetical protein